MTDTNKKPISLTCEAMYPETIPFWKALDEGRLLLGDCPACGKKHFYPRPYCPFCGAKSEFKRTEGRGKLYSFSISRKSSPVVAPAVVELEEGVKLISVVMDADLDALAIGDDVLLRAVERDGRNEIAFTTPAAVKAMDYAKRATAQASESGPVAAAATPTIQNAAVIGAGTMGTGIAIAMASAGIPVLLVDREQVSLDQALDRAREMHQGDIKRGRLTQSQVADRLSLISTSTEMARIGNADVIVEAVWEQLDLKRSLFEQMDRFAKKGALLGTNTSGLDINLLADVTSRPEDVVGLHFFSPAHVMKLLEVVRARVTSDASLARAFELARALRKVPVLVESAPGFAGNRILRRREQECRAMLHEGALPEQIDSVLKEFGMPMGPYEITDMAGGIELHYRKSQENGDTYWLNQEMFRLGRLGQRTGKGYYRYDAGSRFPKPDPEMAQLLQEASRQQGVIRRRISDGEILDRVLVAMINEGARVVEEGIVRTPQDLDAVMLNGYGWPRWRGGLIYHADELGAKTVANRLRALHSTFGTRFEPSQLILFLADTGSRFSAIPSRRNRADTFT